MDLKGRDGSGTPLSSLTLTTVQLNMLSSSMSGHS